MIQPNSERGETIVEVLICLAALGFMLISAFTLTNRNQAAAQASQERSRATKVMETQLELLRGFTTDAILPAGTFCLQENAALNRVDAPASCPPEDGLYNVSVTNPNPAGSLVCNSTLPLTVRVTWDSLIQRTPEELSTHYLACNKLTDATSTPVIGRIA